ncbi:MAG TPA: hypothetical protein VK587_00080 [bacterium]|nr:hypothetical protein [bacterium]
MEQARHQSLAREAEEIVGRLRGVSAVRVDLSDDGKIAQLHVLASAERTPRVIVGDVVAALASELGLSLEPGQVRVAAQRSGPPDPAVPGVRSRLKFVGLAVSRLRTSADVRVQLEHKGLIYEGAASGPGAASHFLELVGQATLKAVETYLRAEALPSAVGVHRAGRVTPDRRGRRVVAGTRRRAAERLRRGPRGTARSGGVRGPERRQPDRGVARLPLGTVASPSPNCPA